MKVSRLGGLHEFLAELRMGDIDQGQHALADGLAMQVGDAVLGNNVMHVAACRDNAGAFAQFGYNARNGLVLVGRGHDDYAFAAPAPGTAADEVDLSADAAAKAITR